MLAGPAIVPVIGCSQRSGTHWLADLLASHPDCRPAMARTGRRGAGWEDLLLESADLLTGYAARTRARWDAAFDSEALEDRLVAALGAGLASFLANPDGPHADPVAGENGTETHVVTKSPTAAGLDLLPRLWPQVRPVLLVRDGGDVLASATASFGGSAERWIRVWRAGTRSIIDFTERHPGRTIVVRYEDLVEDLGATMGSVLAHVGLDAARFDLDAAAALPVRGSSETAAAGDVHWEPVAAAVRSVGRRDGLPAELRTRLGHLAGDELAHFGYAVPAVPDPGRQRVRDLAWAVARAGRRVVRPR